MFKLSSNFILCLVLLTAVTSHADDVDFKKPPKDEEIKRPTISRVAKSFAKLVAKNLILPEGSLSGGYRDRAGNRFYEIELYAVVTGFSLIGNGSDQLALTKQPLGERRYLFLPVTVVGRIDPNGKERFSIARFDVMLGQFGGVAKRYGLDQLSIDYLGFGYANHTDLNLGSSMAFKILSVRLRQVLDVTEDGSVKILFIGKAGFQMSGASDVGRFKDNEVGNSDFGLEAGVFFKNALTLNGLYEYDHNATGSQETENGPVVNVFNRKSYGGRASFKLKRHLDFDLRITNDNYDIETNRVDDSITLSNKHGLGVNAGIKLVW